MNVYEQLPHPGLTLALFAALAIVVGGALMWHGKPLRTKDVPRGIGDFELAGTKQCADHILTKWGEAGRRRAIADTLYDFLFIPCYSTALALLFFCLALCAQRIAPLSTVLTVWAWLMWVAGLLDVIENLCMLRMLTRGSGSDLLARVSQVCATVKFVVILYWWPLLKKGACA